MPTRTTNIRQAKLIEFFTRISQISACSSRKILRLKTPDSIAAWNTFIRQQDILNLYPFIHDPNPAINYVGNLAPEASDALKIEPAYIQLINQAEELKDFEIWAAENPYKAIFLKYSKPIIDYVSGMTLRAQELANEAQRNPNQFFERHQRQILTGATIGLGTVLLLKNL